MARKLVTVRKVKEKNPIPNADMIEQVVVDGWNVVSKKGEFTVGDYGVFFEVDSALPANDERFEFLRKSGVKNFHGKEVIRIRTVRLRGVISQGLFLPMNQFPEIVRYLEQSGISLDDAVSEGIDLSDIVDVVKYEPPMKVRGAEAAGDFPSYIRKTDQERINNVFDMYSSKFKNTTFYATLKMDGSSATFFYAYDEQHKINNLIEDECGGQFVVCSRNMTLKPTDNPWHVAADNLSIERKLREYRFATGKNYAVQGELLGKGIQGTREKFFDYTVRFFAVYDVDNMCYLPYNEVINVFEDLDLPMVPLLGMFNPFDTFSTVQEFIDYSNKLEPIHADIPEGVVYHSINAPHVSFKAISTNYLLKYE